MLNKLIKGQSLTKKERSQEKTKDSSNISFISYLREINYVEIILTIYLHITWDLDRFHHYKLIFLFKSKDFIRLGRK